MTSTLTSLQPIRLALHGTPEWRERRRGGITATELRDWPSPSRRRAIITEKVTGGEDRADNRYYAHGRHREPAILEWAGATYGVVPMGALYAHPENPRHLATPDGHLAGFSLSYEPGSEAVTVEVKTSSKDMTPGPVDAAGFLVSVTPGSAFDLSGYYRQVQWQMYVMNAARCLFIWEPFEPVTDPESGFFRVTGTPQTCIIVRDQDFIEGLIAEADDALAQIDSAILANVSGLPPVSDVPTDEAMLLADLFAARDALAIAEAARIKAWDALTALYADRDDFSEDKGFALVTKSTGKPKVTRAFNRALAEQKAPKALAQHDAFIARYTEVTTTPGKSSITITDRR